MKQREFFTVVARLIEKVTREPVESLLDFDWQRYFDNDLPAPAQKWCAQMAAEDYLRERGHLHSLDPVAVVSSVVVS